MGLRVVEVFEGEVGHDGPPVVQALTRLGVEIRVICPPAAVAAFADVQVTPLVVGTGVTTLATLRRALQDTPAGVDVVHAHGLRAGLAAALTRPTGTPLVLSWSEPVATAGAAWLVGRALTRTVVPAAAVVLASLPELVDAAQHLGAAQVLPATPVLPAPGVVTRSAEQVREELALPPDGPIVLAQARLLEETRLDLLVDASAGWRGPGRPQVVVAGTGPAYRDLVRRATVGRAPVTFAGDRAVAADRAEEEDRAGVVDLLAAASVAVVTDVRARTEFALRAVAAGVPLVVPAGGLLGAQLGRAAVTVPTSDPSALATAVRTLLDEPSSRLALVELARQRVRDWPDATRAAQELRELYERVSRTTQSPA